MIKLFFIFLPIRFFNRYSRDTIRILQPNNPHYPANHAQFDAGNFSVRKSSKSLFYMRDFANRFVELLTISLFVTKT